MESENREGETPGGPRWQPGPRTRSIFDALLRLYEGFMAYAALVFGRDVRWPRRLRYIAVGLAAFAGIVFVLVFLYAIVLIPFTPGTAELRKTKAERPTTVYSADGVRLVEFRPVNREWVPLDGIAREVRMALIATEDRRFYEHSGVDFRRLGGAALSTVRGRREGGSTITQQLARNLYPDRIGRRATLTRKLKELVTTLKIERAFTKDQILETYLNTVPFLYDAYGIEMAARTYFGVSASELDILQSATLVGMLKGTAYYNPVRHPERARERRNLVLRRMAQAGYLQQERYEAIVETPIRLRFERQPRMRSLAPHFTEHIRSWLHGWAERRGYNIYRDSLVVHTTLDTRLQEAAQQSVDRWMPTLQAIAETEWSRPEVRLISRSPEAYRRGGGFSYLWDGRPELVRAFIRSTPQYRSGVASGVPEEVMLDSLRSNQAFMEALRQLKTRVETGFVAMKPTNGHVLAWVGSHSFSEVPYDHVAVARRQPGSTFKPIVYAAALENGFRPDDTLPDTEVEFELPNGEVWTPTNVGGSSGRDLTLTEGLAQSKNTITAQLIDQVGVSRVARLAERMGVSRSRLTEVPSLALGTSEVSLLEMVSAYATIANGGIYNQPVIITHIEDPRGRVIYEARPRQRRAISEETALRVNDMMRDVVDRGTGQRIRTTFGIREDLSGKTGTTQGNMDGWFVGMHPELVAGSWVGFDDPRITFRSDYWGAGGNNALLLVGEFYRRAFRHPETRLVGQRFPEAPEYPERVTIADHFRSWASTATDWVATTFADAVDWVRSLIGDPDGSPTDPVPTAEPQPERRTAPAARPRVEDVIRAEVDSLVQAARDSIRLEDILRRLEDEGGGRVEPRPLEDVGRPDDDADEEPERGPPEHAQGQGQGADPPGRAGDGLPPGQARQDRPRRNSPRGRARGQRRSR
jgi:penicillin-binding protein 1A